MANESLREWGAGDALLSLKALAAAESLTDDVARRLYELRPVEGVSAELFIRSLHYADFVMPRNSEWQFTTSIRREIQEMAIADSSVVQSAHELLLSLSESGDPSEAGSTIPGYLFTNAGQAYHRAELGEVGQAINLYRWTANTPLGEQWLAAKLSEEQEKRKILPAGQLEITFLRGMVFYREGDRRRAEPLLRRVAEADESRSEVAIALHIVGNYIARQQPDESERMYRRSVEIGEALDDRFGVGQVLHSLANLISRNRKRRGEAERLYRRSIEIGEAVNDQFGVAQRLHSLANLIGRKPRGRKEAEELFKRTLKWLLRDRSGYAETLHSFANLLARQPDRFAEAEKLYRQSIAIGEELHEQFSVAQREHSLGSLLETMGRHDEAEVLLRRSLAAGERLGNMRHMAQLLRTLSFVVERRSPKEAEALLLRSLSLNKEMGNRDGLELVQRALDQLHRRYPR